MIQTSLPTAPAQAAAPYLAPAIETVISPDQLQREVFYAGTAFLSDPPPISPFPPTLP